MAAPARYLSVGGRGRYLSASGGARRLGRNVRHCAESAADRPIGWRPHLLFLFPQTSPDGFDRALRDASPFGPVLVAVVLLGAAPAVAGQKPSGGLRSHGTRRRAGQARLDRA